MKAVKRSLAALLCLVAVALAPPARAAAPADPLAGFDEFLETAIAGFDVPGLAVCVVKDGRVIYEKGVGLRDVDRRLPVTPKTLFAIASCTKAFTTFVLGTLVDEGRLDWDRPVASYLPGFRMYDQTATSLITPRDLVTHRSGLPRHELLWYNSLEPSRREIVERLPYLEPSEPLRAKWQYNNLMYVTAGYLAEHVTGKSWEENVRERVLDPLGMARTNFSVLDSQRSDDFARPYEERDGRVREVPFRVATTVGPAGSMNSCAEDLAKWAALHLGGGAFAGRRLVSAATLADMHAPQMPTGDTAERPDVSTKSYGLGWFVYTYRGHETVEHGGNLDGFTSLVTLLPQDGLGVVVLANKDVTPLPTIVARHAVDRLLGLAPVDWYGEGLARRTKGLEEGERARARKASVRRPGTKPAHALEDYAGEYEHPGYGTLRVAARDGRLDVTFNGIATPLEHWHYETFGVPADFKDPALENVLFTFQTDVKGNVAAVSSALEPSVRDIVFAKRPDARLSDPAYLAKLAGAYDLAGLPVTIALLGNGLTVTFPGGPQLHLVPGLGGEFELREDSTISCSFIADERGEVTGINVFRPSGVYFARRKG